MLAFFAAGCGETDRARQYAAIALEAADAPGSAHVRAESLMCRGLDLALVAGLLVEAAEECLAEVDTTSWVVVVATLAHVAWRGGDLVAVLELTGAVRR